MTPFIVAIDGPAASGKGTLARRIAIHYGMPHLDTGLTYRAVAKALIDKGLPLDDEAVAADVALNLDLREMDKAVLSAHAIGEAASKVAVMPKVRRALVEAQGYEGMHEVEIFSSQDWWQRSGEETLTTCIERHRSVV